MLQTKFLFLIISVFNSISKPVFFILAAFNKAATAPDDVAVFAVTIPSVKLD